LKWKAEQSKHRAIEKKQRDTPNWPVLANAISRTLCTKGLQSDLLAWPRIWSVSGVSELVGASYTGNRKTCRPIFVDVGLESELASGDIAAALTKRRIATPAGRPSLAWHLTMTKLEAARRSRLKRGARQRVPSFAPRTPCGRGMAQTKKGATSAARARQSPDR
jgi:hypothetical protein